ncbi:hypothetical protein [Campylobacter helveticus]|uniref:hypothetical protein n=1 Tax=Campylobacter helveticus TaxID=28898 RepID=UPI00243085BB|nr:hypothetical protein [Campylobacter helveticus]
MLEEDFLKEKQNIRQKMLKYSRAMTRGIPMDEELKKEISSDDILRRRVKNKRQNLLNEEFFEPNSAKKSNIYLKEDLINVKLEERQPLGSKFFVYFKGKKRAKENKKEEKESVKTENKKVKGEKKRSFTFSFKRVKKVEQALKKETLTQINTTKESSNLNQIKPTSFNANPKISVSKSQAPQKINLKAEKKETKIKAEFKKVEEKPLKLIEKETNTQPIATTKELDIKALEAKNTLLEGFSNATKEDRNLNANHLLFASLLITFALFLFAPQIYIRNQIYYLSREIATLKAEESVLNEENKELKRRLENMRFQNQILDYLE